MKSFKRACVCVCVFRGWGNIIVVMSDECEVCGKDEELRICDNSGCGKGICQPCLEELAERSEGGFCEACDQSFCCLEVHACGECGKGTCQPCLEELAERSEGGFCEACDQSFCCVGVFACKKCNVSVCTNCECECPKKKVKKPVKPAKKAPPPLAVPKAAAARPPPAKEGGGAPQQAATGKAVAVPPTPPAAAAAAAAAAEAKAPPAKAAAASQGAAAKLPNENMTPANVVRIMNAATGDAQVIGAGAAALKMIAWRHDGLNARACVTAGAIPALVGALTRHSGEAGVCAIVSAALGCIACSSDARRDACAAAIPALVTALARHAGVAALCRDAFAALCYFMADYDTIGSSARLRGACATAGVIPLCVGALARHAGEEEVCQVASSALMKLTDAFPDGSSRESVRERCRAAVAVGAVPRLAAAWAAHRKDATRFALRNLGYSTDGNLKPT